MLVINTNKDEHCIYIKPQTWTAFIAQEEIDFWGQACVVYDWNGKKWGDFYSTNTKSIYLPPSFYVLFNRRKQYSLSYRTWVIANKHRRVRFTT
jgi:uncharacterized membrane protein (DUF2068 family)